MFDCARVYLDKDFTFSGCKVKSLSLSSYIDTSNLTVFNFMFYGIHIEYLDLHNLNTSNATDMCYMFSDSEILSINFNGMDTSKVRSMEGMFAGLNSNFEYGTGNINISGFNKLYVFIMSCKNKRIRYKWSLFGI